MQKAEQEKAHDIPFSYILYKPHKLEDCAGRSCFSALYQDKLIFVFGIYYNYEDKNVVRFSMCFSLFCSLVIARNMLAVKLPIFQLRLVLELKDKSSMTSHCLHVHSDMDIVRNELHPPSNCTKFTVGTLVLD